MILRLYGKAKVIHKNDQQWQALFSLFDLSIDLVQTSCGMSVPYFDDIGGRQPLTDWSIKKGEQGVQQYWQDKNQISLDGKPINILDKNI